MELWKKRKTSNFFNAMKMNIKKESIVVFLTIGFSLIFNAPAAKAQCVVEPRTLTTGDNVPAFTLKDQDGQTFNLSKVFEKKKLIIFFHPKDESQVSLTEQSLTVSGIS